MRLAVGDGSRSPMRVSPRDGLPAVRDALVGSAHGLPLAVIIDVLGMAESRSRLRAATM